MVNQPTLHDIDELVVAVRIRWPEEEARIKQVANRVGHDSLHDFTVGELQADPDSGNGWGSGMKVKVGAPGLSLKTVDVEDSLDFAGLNLLHHICVKEADAEGSRGVEGSVGEKVFNASPSGVLDMALESALAKFDNYSFRPDSVG